MCLLSEFSEMMTKVEKNIFVAETYRNRGHQLLGRAKVPQAVLVGESWVEGSAPVFAVPGEGTNLIFAVQSRLFLRFSDGSLICMV
jgi:hypothetical protein